LNHQRHAPSASGRSVVVVGDHDGSRTTPKRRELRDRMDQLTGTSVYPPFAEFFLVRFLSLFWLANHKRSFLNRQKNKLCDSTGHSNPKS
jgi:hypothetical protein